MEIKNSRATKRHSEQKNLYLMRKLILLVAMIAIRFIQSQYQRSIRLVC